VNPQVERLCKCLSRELGLTLFGVDLIQDSEGQLYSIDVNYFPGYDGVASFHDRLAEHIKQRATAAASAE
jgi:glutathione synthase/RimK-type ligase-like ATP-grasp enzyme